MEASSYEVGHPVRAAAIEARSRVMRLQDGFRWEGVLPTEYKAPVDHWCGITRSVLIGDKGEATAFDKVYEQYKLAPGVTKRRMYYETMERVLQNVDKTIIEAPGVNPYLPLNELKRTAPREPQQ